MDPEFLLIFLAIQSNSAGVGPDGPSSTVKFINFRMQENFAVIYLKIKRRNLRVFCPKHAYGIVYSEEPDQTAPLRAV